MSYITGLKLPIIKRPKQLTVPKNPIFSIAEKQQIETSVQKLLNLKAVSQVLPSKDQFLSPIFLIPKPDGTKRLILNLKSFNKFVSTPHFKLEDNKTVVRIIEKGYFMASIDLKDAYFLVPVYKPHRKYLRFTFNGCVYQYNVMPFGLNCAPFVFTKLMKPVLSVLRSRGHLSVLYLDDFLLLGHSYVRCISNIKDTLGLLESLGFVVNFEKSHLIPSQQIRYLGFIYNSQSMAISLPSEKTSRLLELIERFLTTKRCKIRDFARFIGTLISVSPAIKYGYVYTKLFERHKFLALRSAGGNYNAIMSISDILIPDFTWWKEKIPTAHNSIKISNFSMEIYSDASGTGWGIYSNGVRSHGFWSEFDKQFHINYLELLAAFFALRCFAANSRNCNILLRIDNTTAISYINRMGSIQFLDLNGLSRKIWTWCEERNIYVYASYIKSSDNAFADEESRRLDVHTEWELNASAFRKIQQRFGNPEIDLFATRINKKCENFVSWFRDPDCYKVDAFTLNWKHFYFYAFPPFCQILKVLQKIINDKAKGIVVVPVWTSQAWYPVFTSLLEGEPIIFKPNKNLLCFNRTPHPLWKHLSLAAGILSYKPYKKEMCRKSH